MSERLRSLNIDPSESSSILGEVEAQFILESPELGWGDERTNTEEEGR